MRAPFGFLCGGFYFFLFVFVRQQAVVGGGLADFFAVGFGGDGDCHFFVAVVYV